MPPSRPPDTRDLVTRRQRALASADASRYDLANRVFNVAAKNWFGPQARMPMVYWRGHTPDRFLDVEANPAVPIAEAYYKGARNAPASYRQGVVAYPTGQDPWLHPQPPWRGMGERGKRQRFIDILLHELAHTQQRAHWSNVKRTEGGADAFTMLARDQVIRQLGLGNEAAYPFSSGYGQWGNQYVHRYGPMQALYGQFGQRGRRYIPFLTGSEKGTYRGRPGF